MQSNLLQILLYSETFVIYIVTKEELSMKLKPVISLSILTALAFGTFLTVPMPSKAVINSNVTNVTKSTNNPNSTYKTASLHSFKLVRAQHAVKIFSKASTKSTVLDSVKNNQGVVVLRNYSNGWSKVSLQFSSGYIQTKYLTSVKANINTPYAMNINKTYSYYIPGNTGSDFKTYYKAKYQTVYKPNKTLTHFWFLNSEPDPYGKMEYETSKGLYTGYKDIGIATLAVKYPVKLNKTWKGLNGQTLKIISTKKTVKTKSGIYKNVVIVKEGKGKNYSYYAPHIGLIKQELNGRTFSELASIDQ